MKKPISKFICNGKTQSRQNLENWKFSILKIHRTQQNPNRLGVVALRGQGLRWRVQGHDVLHRETMSQKIPNQTTPNSPQLKEDAYILTYQSQRIKTNRTRASEMGQWVTGLAAKPENLSSSLKTDMEKKTETTSTSCPDFHKQATSCPNTSPIPTYINNNSGIEASTDVQ